MEKTLSPQQLIIKQAIKEAKLGEKKLDELSNSELNRVIEVFNTSKMLVHKEKFGVTEFTSALNKVCFFENEDEYDETPFEEEMR